MKAVGVRAEQKGRIHGRYRPALRDKPESPCQRGAVHTWDEALIARWPSTYRSIASVERRFCIKSAKLG
jgi:hypothetical protein